jgi:PAS domain S-box-containing protein
MITGTGCEALAVEALKLGVKDYIIKDVEGQYINLLPTVFSQVLKEQALIQEKERAVQALKRSEERYRTMVEHSPDAILVCREGLVIFANPTACRFLGAHYPEAVLGKPLAAFWPAVPSMDILIEQAGQRGAVPELPSPPVQDRIVRLDGDPLDVELATVLLDGNSALQIIARDISWRKLAEEELRRTNDELEQRVTARTQDLQKLNLQLQEKIIELEAFHDATVGREHKMMALKEEVDKLRKELALLRGNSPA